MHRMRAGALLYLGDVPAALADLERRELFTELGYTTEHAYLHSNFGSVLSRLGRYGDAIAHHQQALDLYRAAGLRLGEALAMEGIGSCANRMGDYDRAIDSITDALRIHQELGDSGGEANSLASLGQSYDLLGEHARAADFTERALLLYRAMGSAPTRPRSWWPRRHQALGRGPTGAGACFASALAISTSCACRRPTVCGTG